MEQTFSLNFNSPMSQQNKTSLTPSRSGPNRIKALIVAQFKKIDSEKIISDYKEKSRQRTQTTKFIRSRQQASQNDFQNIVIDSYEKKNILSSPTSPASPTRRARIFIQDKTFTSCSSTQKRQQIKQVESLFQEKINENQDKKVLLDQTEKFISDAMLFEFKELGSLFNTFMKATHDQIQDQQFEININEKKSDIKKIDEILRMNSNYNKKQEKYENSIKILNQQILDLQQQKADIEKNLTLLIEKNNQLTTKLTLKNKEMLLKHQQLTKLVEDKAYLKKKIKILQLRSKKSQQIHLEEEDFDRRSDSLSNSQNQEKYLMLMKQSSFSLDICSESIDDVEEYRLDEVVLNHQQIVEWRTKETQTTYDLLNSNVDHHAFQTNLTLIDKDFDLINEEILRNSLKLIDFFNKLNNQQLGKIDYSNNDSVDLMLNSQEFQQQQVNFSNQNELLTLMKHLFQKNNQLEKQCSTQKEDIVELNSQLLQQAHDKHDLREENQSLKLQLAELLKRLEGFSANQLNIGQGEFLTGNDLQTGDQAKQSNQKNQPRKVRKIRNLGTKISISYEFQKNQSRLLIDKVKNKTFAKFNNYMPVKLILKFILTIYSDKIYNQKENKILRDQDLSSYIYNYFLQQFGYTKITEQRFLILILSVKKYLNVVRVNMFAKFMGLLDEKVNYSVEEQQKYLQAHDFISNLHQLGVSVKENDYSLKYYIPYIRAIAYISSLQNCYFSVEEMNYLKQEIEVLKEVDDKNKGGIIDFDLMMIRVLIVFRNNIEKTKLYVINAFNACDLDGNGFVDIEEWLLLNKYIEPQKYDENELVQIFDDAADMQLDEEKNLSFDRFSILCMEMELFSDEQQNKFLRSRNNFEAEQMFIELRKGWLNEYVMTLNKIKKQQKLDEATQQHWIQILNILNEKILLNPLLSKPLLISYKILQGEIS